MIQKQINTVAVFAIIAISLQSCLSNKYSYKSRGEEVYVEIIHKSDDNYEFPVQSVMMAKGGMRTRGVVPLLAAPYIFNMAIRGVSKIVDKGSKKYSASYTAKNSDDMFYTDNTNKADINIEKIKFVRLVEAKKNIMDTALVLTLGVQLSSDGNFVRLTPEHLKVNYTKAKLKMGDKKFDLDLHITINGFWLDAQHHHNIKEIASLDITLYNVPVRGELSQSVLKNSATQWFPVIPRSQLEEGIYGTGNFLVDITANEFDEYGKRVQSVSGGLEGSRDDVLNMMKDVSKRKVKEYDAQPQK